MSVVVAGLSEYTEVFGQVLVGIDTKAVFMPAIGLGAIYVGCRGVLCHGIAIISEFTVVQECQYPEISFLPAYSIAFFKLDGLRIGFAYFGIPNRLVRHRCNHGESKTERPGRLAQFGRCS